VPRAETARPLTVLAVRASMTRRRFAMLVVILVLLLVVALVGAILLGRRLAKLSKDHAAFVERFRTVLDAEAERGRIQAQMNADRAQWEQALAGMRAQYEQGQGASAQLQASIAALRAEFAALDEEANLQSFGFYRPRYAFAESSAYQTRLEEIRATQKRMLADGTAAFGRTQWTVNGSAAEGRKQINQTLKLILRAFNGECDAAIAKVTYRSANVMDARIRKAWEAINKLVTVQECEISSAYLELKLQELYLSHEYEEKVQEEKEEQRRIKEQMREEEAAQREIEKAEQEAEREEERYAEALRRAEADVEKAVGAKQQKLLGQIEELQRKLTEAQANKERAKSRAQMTRSGHVYVISNVGSFGDTIFKIGMTRRLEPMDRVRELGDASVPFSFDVHAMIWCEDAPTLENALHRHFHYRRLNLVNDRKEFFAVEINEIVEAVGKLHGEIEITKLAEAKEYRQSNAIRQERETAKAAGQPTPAAPVARPVGAMVPA
jgi:Sec-independent protein translocase protein TatA